MSEGSVFKCKDGKWCAKYKGADGSWKYIYRKARTEAKQALRAALKDRDEGKTPVRRNGVTVGEAVQMYMGEMDVSERTLRDRRYLVKNHLLPALAHKKVSTVTPDTIRTFYRQSPWHHHQSNCFIPSCVTHSRSSAWRGSSHRAHAAKR